MKDSDKGAYFIISLIFVLGFLFGGMVGCIYTESRYEDLRFDSYSLGVEDTFNYVDHAMTIEENFTVSQYDRDYGFWYMIGASRFPNDSRFDGSPKLRLFGVVVYE